MMSLVEVCGYVPLPMALKATEFLFIILRTTLKP